MVTYNSRESKWTDSSKQEHVMGQKMKRSEAVWKKEASCYFTVSFVLCGSVKPALIVSFYVYNSAPFLKSDLEFRIFSLKFSIVLHVCVNTVLFLPGLASCMTSFLLPPLISRLRTSLSTSTSQVSPVTAQRPTVFVGS